MKKKKSDDPLPTFWKKEEYNSGKILYCILPLKHQNGIGFWIQVSEWFFSTCKPKPKSTGNFESLFFSGTNYCDFSMENLSYVPVQPAFYKQATSYLTILIYPQSSLNNLPWWVWTDGNCHYTKVYFHIVRRSQHVIWDGSHLSPGRLQA